MKQFTLCADDYGQSFSVSQAIIDLLKQKRLSATSCLTTEKDWIIYAEQLHPFVEAIDIGLHFNLTEGRALSEVYIQEYGKNFMSLPTLILKSCFRKLNENVIEKELNAQIDQFILGMKREPDFIDGHQHMHQFPIVRDVLIRVYEKRFKNKKPYIRCTYQKEYFQKNFIKRQVIQMLGASKLKKKLKDLEIPHNQSFEGIYSFSSESHYAQEFCDFLSRVGNQGLIMCHPGLAGENTEDPIAHARFLEYQYFSSDQFLKDCEEVSMQVGRLFV